MYKITARGLRKTELGKCDIAPLAIMAGVSIAQAGYGLYTGAKAGREAQNRLDDWNTQQRGYLDQLSALIEQMPVEMLTKEDIDDIVKTAKEDYMDMYLKTIKPQISSQYQTRGLYGSEIMAKQEGAQLTEIGKAVARQRQELLLNKKVQDKQLQAQKLQARMNLLGQRAGVASSYQQAQIGQAQATSQAGYGAFGSALTNLSNLYLASLKTPKVDLGGK